MCAAYRVTVETIFLKTWYMPNPDEKYHSYPKECHN